MSAEEAWQAESEMEVEYELAENGDSEQQQQEEEQQQQQQTTQRTQARPQQPPSQQSQRRPRGAAPLGPQHSASPAPTLMRSEYDEQQHDAARAQPLQTHARSGQRPQQPPHETVEDGQRQWEEEQKQNQEHQQHYSQADQSQHTQQQEQDAQQPQQPHWDSQAIHAAAHAAIASGDEAVVAQFLSLLEAHRSRCERRHLYIEAALAEEKLRELRAHEDARRLHALTTRHLAEKLDLEEAHILEFNEFNQVWGRDILAPFDAETRAKQTAMLARHVTELEQWTRDQQEQAFMRPKFSKQLLALRNLQEAHGRAREYAKAERVRVQALQLERVELESLRHAWAGRVQSKRARFLDAQARELHAFSARRAEERLSLEARQRTELRVQIVQKYQNLSSELERAQAKEKKRLEKMHELGVSESTVLREEAPRRVHLPAEDDQDEDAATGTEARPSPPAARATSANSVGRMRVLSSAARRRASREDAAAGHRPSSASNVPTISGAMSARYPGSGTVPSPQQQYPHPFTARSSAPLPDSSQLVTRKSSTQQQTQQQAPPQPPARPLSSSYDSQARRTVITRGARTVSASIHYSRPPTRAGNSKDRDREMADVLMHGAPPLAAAVQPPPRAPLSYVDRMGARQTVAQKVRGGSRGHGFPSISADGSAASSSHPPAHMHPESARRMQQYQAIMSSRRSIHSSSDDEDF